MDKQNNTRLLRKLSPLAVWALSFGCSVGWGSFVMPGTTFLPNAGPLGTAIGISAGALIMVIFGVNYSYLINRYPDSGGTYSYSKNLFGYDHGLLSAWFMGLVYLAITWANATAIPLIFRNIFGDALQFGYCYTIAGYDVYAGEILLSLAALLVFGFICLRGIKLTAVIQTVLAILLIAAVAFAFIAAFIKRDTSASAALVPLFSKDRSPFIGILLVISMAPWAFAGFESVSHTAEEYKFPHKKILRVLIIGIVTSAAAYIMLSLIAASAQPEGFSNWSDYLKGMGSLGVVKGMPTLYGVYSSLGSFGLVIIGVAAAAAIITGLVGNITAASRLMYSMSRDDMLPERFGRLNRFGSPYAAIIFIVAMSLPIPFFGRSAISWIVDVNTIGVTVAYAYTSAAAFRQAKLDNKRGMKTLGISGIVISAFFLIYFLTPKLATSFSVESYLILMLWAVLGFVLFYLLFRRDRFRRMGKSIVIWVVLLLLIFFTSTVWVVDTTEDSTRSTVEELGAIYEQDIGSDITDADEAAGAFKTHLEEHIDGVSGTIIRNTVFVFLMILLSMFIIFNTYNTVKKRHETAVEGRVVAEQSSKAKTNFLSNMSHDIRTPMNAIVGYVTLAKREKNLSPRVTDYLDKIEDSSGHLLSLINDVLEMSRIESGKMELMPVPTDICAVMKEVKDLFITQMQTKGLKYDVIYEDVADRCVLCDKNRFDRVLLNLISNAYKFTPEGGSVTVTLSQTARVDDKASFRISVKDTGIGMSKEFAAKVFEAYEREKTTTVENIQGTGLGTAITKSIVDLMGGEIQVFSEKGKGSEFVIDVDLPIDPKAGPIALDESDKQASAAFAGMRILLVEDDPDNREVEKTLLEEAGFTVDTAENGEEGAELVAASVPGEYAVVLMDIEMPVKNGYSAAKLIRSLRNPALASIPIVALTAKAFSEDISAALEAGMNAHISKPINMKTVISTFKDILS